MGGEHCQMIPTREWRSCYLPGVPVISMTTSCSPVPVGRAALSPFPEVAVHGKLGCSAGRTLAPSEDFLFPGWVPGQAVFWPCRSVRHFLQQEHKAGEPPVPGEKKNSVLCDCHEMQVTGLQGSGLGAEKCVNSCGSHPFQVEFHRGSSERLLVSDKLMVGSWFEFLTSRVSPGLSPVPRAVPSTLGVIPAAHP